MIAEKDFAGRQTLGKRKQQEDTYAFSDIPGAGENEQGLFIVVADGMGGHTSGDQASELALESFIDTFHLSEGTLGERMKSSALAANAALAKEMKDSPDLEGMGTTLLVAAITSLGIEWISIGDSPLYLWRDGMLNRLNQDHSFRPMLDEMVEAGDIRPDEAARHPLKNILRAALTGRRIDLMDQSPQPLALQPGDIILAATDGIQTLPDEQISAIVSDSAYADASELAANLLQAVDDVDYVKQDNTTVAIIKATHGIHSLHRPQL